jgi:hypothetical protein
MGISSVFRTGQPAASCESRWGNISLNKKTELAYSIGEAMENSNIKFIHTGLYVMAAKVAKAITAWRL